MASNSNPFLDMFKDFGKSMDLPGADVSNMMEYHQKNLQALQDATQVSTNMAQALMAKQSAALEQTLSDIADTVKTASSGGDATDMAQAPMELARKTFEATLENTRDMAEIVQKGNEETFQVLKDRVMESVEELSGKKS